MVSTIFSSFLLLVTLYFVWLQIFGHARGSITCPAAGDFPDPADCQIIQKCPYAGAPSFPIACPPGTVFDTVCKWPYQTTRICNESTQGTSTTQGRSTLPSSTVSIVSHSPPSPTSEKAETTPRLPSSSSKTTVTTATAATTATPTAAPRPTVSVSMLCIFGERCRRECERYGYSSGLCEDWLSCRCN